MNTSLFRTNIGVSPRFPSLKRQSTQQTPGYPAKALIHHDSSMSSIHDFHKIHGGLFGICGMMTYLFSQFVILLHIDTIYKHERVHRRHKETVYKYLFAIDYRSHFIPYVNNLSVPGDNHRFHIRFTSKRCSLCLPKIFFTANIEIKSCKTTDSVPAHRLLTISWSPVSSNP